MVMTTATAAASTAAARTTAGEARDLLRRYTALKPPPKATSNIPIFTH